MNKTNEIDFTNAIITPLKQWVNMELELDDDVVNYLNALSGKTNQSIDNIVTHILTDLLSEHMELSELSPKKLQAVGKRNSHIILMDKNRPFARIELINQEEVEAVFNKIGLQNSKGGNSVKNKMTVPKYDYECASEHYERV